MEILDRVHLIEIKLPFPQTPSVNIFFIQDEKCALIDSGPGLGLSSSIISGYLKKIGCTLEDISFIINTHEHVEHVGGNPELKLESNEILAHEKAVEAFRYYKDISPRWFGIDGRNPWERLPSLPARKLCGGETIDLGEMTLEAIHTPGHSPGHICLLENGRKILFSGDHVLGDGTPYIGTRRSYPIKGNMSEYLSSLELLLRMDVKLLLPAHGPVSKEPEKRIRETIERKKEREKEVLLCLQNGPKRPAEILPEVYGVKDEFLKGSIIAYLEKLERDGKVERFEREEKGKMKIYFRLR